MAQMWDYSSQKKQLKVKRGLCAQAHGTARVVMATCDPSVADQQFEFTHGALRQKGTELCIEGDSNDNGEAWSRLATCKSQTPQQWLYNRFDLDEHLVPGAQLDAAFVLSGVDEGGFSIDVRNALMKALEQLDTNMTLVHVGLSTVSSAHAGSKRVRAEVRLVASALSEAETLKGIIVREMSSDEGRANFDSMMAAALPAQPNEESLVLHAMLQGDIEVIPMPGPGSANCKLSMWGNFAPCSKECGGGFKARVRTIVRPAVSGGKRCGALKQSQKCNEAPCVEQACIVSQWSGYAECSKACGTGVQKRLRRVMVQPTNGAPYCPDLEDSRPCHTQPCDIVASPQEVIMLGNDDRKLSL
jgi:hypothetical protein